MATSEPEELVQQELFETPSTEFSENNPGDMDITWEWAEMNCE